MFALVLIHEIRPNFYVKHDVSNKILRPIKTRKIFVAAIFVATKIIYWNHTTNNICLFLMFHKIICVNYARYYDILIIKTT